jgi:biotin operon repressor
MSIHLLSDAWKRPVGDAKTKLVMLRLADSANDDGIAWPHIETIARDTELSERSIYRAISKLEEDGIIIRDRSQRGCVYRFLTCQPDSDLPHSQVRPATQSGVVSKRTIKEPKSISLPFDSDLFQRAWQRWTTYRKQLKKPLTEASMEMQLAKLRSWGEAAAVQSISNSIENGWQGLFEPKGMEKPTTSNQYRI